MISFVAFFSIKVFVMPLSITKVQYACFLFMSHFPYKIIQGKTIIIDCNIFFLVMSFKLTNPKNLAQKPCQTCSLIVYRHVAINSLATWCSKGHMLFINRVSILVFPFMYQVPYYLI